MKLCFNALLVSSGLIFGTFLTNCGDTSTEKEDDYSINKTVSRDSVELFVDKAMREQTIDVANKSMGGLLISELTAADSYYLLFIWINLRNNKSEVFTFHRNDFVILTSKDSYIPAAYLYKTDWPIAFGENVEISLTPGENARLVFVTIVDVESSALKLCFMDFPEVEFDRPRIIYEKP